MRFGKGKGEFKKWIKKPRSNEMIKPTRISTFPIHATLKIDGSMQLMVKEKNGDVFLLTKRKRIRRFESPWFEKELREIPNDSLFMCELYGVDEEGNSLDRREMMSLITTQNAPIETENEMRLMVFDLIKLDGETVKGKSYEERIERLEELFPNNIGRYIHSVRKFKIKDKRELTRIWVKWVEMKKFEGLMVYNPKSSSPTFTKIKPLVDMDVVIMGFKTTLKQYKKGLLGSVDVGIFDDEKNALVKTNSLTIGISHPFKNRDDTQRFLRVLLEKMVTRKNSRRVEVYPTVVVEQTVESFYLENGNLSCQQPSFQRIRFDKSNLIVGEFLNKFKENKECLAEFKSGSDECFECPIGHQCQALSLGIIDELAVVSIEDITTINQVISRSALSESNE